MQIKDYFEQPVANTEQVVDILPCPSHLASGWSTDRSGYPWGYTFYVSVTENERYNYYDTSGNFLEDTSAITRRQPGSVGGVAITAITGGTSSTLLAGERAPSPIFTYGKWTAPDDEFDALDVTSPVVWVTASFYEYEADGTACPVPAPFRSGNPDSYCSFDTVWSMHSGGAYFLFGDGSVRFLSHQTALADNPGAGKSVLESLVSRAGDEIVPGL